MAEKSKKNKSESKTEKKTPSIKTICYSAVAVIIILIFSIFVDHSDNTDNNSLGNIQVHYIDVGQGDCILIEAEGENMLIDCGESSKSDEVLAYLQSQNISHLDYLVGTHPHSDHMGGMSTVVDNLEIDNFYMPYLPDDDIPTTKYFEKLLLSLENKNMEIKNPEAGDKIRLGSAELTVISPNQKEYSNTNNYSIGFILTHGDNSFIFTGDAEASAEEEMINNGLLRDIDVYKAGHHGSSTSSSEAFLDVIKPEYAVIMCGEGNSYGHPNDDAVERIKKYVTEENILRTDFKGSIVAKSDGKTIDFTSER